MKLNKKQITNFLPHRDPFLFLDSIEEITYPDSLKSLTLKSLKQIIGGKVVAHFHVTPELKILAGHFPGNPILPGVIQLEIMAQASTFINLKILESEELCGLDIDVALLGVDKARFRRPIVPGMKLKVITECTKVRGNFVGYSCEIYENDLLVSQADILASFKYKKK
ncbi:beta-hydroxyacyl-ACP dehydratase [Bacteriovoracaceae bacterium]|nr:beta-hydroxyacyl-ACP dehydratase [Bacteriovoracaceae bacterium]